MLLILMVQQYTRLLQRIHHVHQQMHLSSIDSFTVIVHVSNALCDPLYFSSILSLSSSFSATSCMRIVRTVVVRSVLVALTVANPCTYTATTSFFTFIQQSHSFSLPCNVSQPNQFRPHFGVVPLTSSIVQQCSFRRFDLCMGVCHVHSCVFQLRAHHVRKTLHRIVGQQRQSPFAVSSRMCSVGSS